uniref:Uncharacterized protein n=1 Tax=Anguilla anguilla TaxID=7936 RepID=A0A0E9VSG2_ANGAN
MPNLAGRSCDLHWVILVTQGTVFVIVGGLPGLIVDVMRQG